MKNLDISSNVVLELN